MEVPFSLCCDATAADVPSRSTALCDPFALLLPKRCLGGNRETGVLFCILCLQRTKKKNRKRRGKKNRMERRGESPNYSEKSENGLFQKSFGEQSRTAPRARLVRGVLRRKSEVKKGFV